MKKYFLLVSGIILLGLILTTSAFEIYNISSQPVTIDTFQHLETSNNPSNHNFINVFFIRIALVIGFASFVSSLSILRKKLTVEENQCA